MGMAEWLQAIKTNPYKQAYDSRKGFLKNCEDIGKMRQAERKKLKEQAKQSKELKELRRLKQLEK